MNKYIYVYYNCIYIDLLLGSIWARIEVYGIVEDISDAIDLIAEDLTSGETVVFMDVETPYTGNMMVNGDTYVTWSEIRKVGYINSTVTSFE